MVDADITVVVNLHDEGNLLVPTINSVFSAIEFAKDRSIVSKVICVLDKSDRRTKEVIGSVERPMEIYETAFGDLSAARNFGAGKAGTKYTTFIDGDDLWGHKWLANSYAVLENEGGDRNVVHPELNLYFGRDFAPYFWVHPDMRVDKVSLVDILVENRWTALSFAQTETYLKYEYRKNEIAKGLGYEDWLWHIQTISEGYQHIVAKDTIHFVRRKQSGGLLQRSNTNYVIPRIADLEFDLSKVLSSQSYFKR